jgi:hypothetical protein
MPDPAKYSAKRWALLPLPEANTASRGQVFIESLQLYEKFICCFPKVLTEQ